MNRLASPETKVGEFEECENRKGKKAENDDEGLKG